MILITLRDLVEEIRVYNDHLSDKRRRAMNVALTNALQDIMAFFKKFIEMQYQLFMQMRTLPHSLRFVYVYVSFLRFVSVESEEAWSPCTGNEKHAHLVTAVLNTIAAYLEWTPIEYAPSFHFIYVLPFMFCVCILCICGYPYTCTLVVFVRTSLVLANDFPLVFSALLQDTQFRTVPYHYDVS